jgi:hypothetical protein
LTTNSQKHEAELADAAGSFYYDPLGWVMFAYDWGQGDLTGFKGPDKWQVKYLEALGEQIRKRDFDGVNPVDPIQMATGSGHGIGKSALTAWLVGFITSTRPYCKGVVTANTSPQLRTKTWAEIQKWNSRSIFGHWFNVTAGQHMKMVHVDHPESWRVDAQTCAKENSESFAGLHAANSTPFYIYDEASAIDDSIWEVSEGGLTDGEPMWFVFGNPTRSSGRFFQCFNRMKHRWVTQQIDSRTAKMTNKAKIKEWVDDYGEDSDFVRVRVRGMFPKGAGTNFIARGDLDKCLEYDASDYHDMPRTIAVDVARFGDDQTVISKKHGRKVFPMMKYRELSTTQTAAYVAEQIAEFKPDAVFIDGGGVGGGVVDRLRQMGHDVFDVNFGSKATQKNKYANKRAEMYGLCRDAIKAGLDLPGDIELIEELGSIEYGFDSRQALLLEKKEEMKKRGLSSPDCADALVLHWAEKISSEPAKPIKFHSPFG